MKQVEKRKLRSEARCHTGAYLLFIRCHGVYQVLIDCDILSPEDFHPATV